MTTQGELEKIQALEEIAREIRDVREELQNITNALQEIVSTTGGPWPKALAEALDRYDIGR